MKKLPTSAKDMFEMFLTETNQRTDDPVLAMKVAWDFTKDNYTEPKLHKSMAIINPLSTRTDNFIEVMLGKPTIDKDDDYLDFWTNHPIHPIVGDIEHQYYKRNEGMYIEEDESTGFVATAERFYNKDDGSLWAKVEIPNHSFTPEFMKRWDSGEYGVSIEYDCPEYAIQHEISDGKVIRKITDGIIKGFSFTQDPAINETFNKNGKQR